MMENSSPAHPKRSLPSPAGAPSRHATTDLPAPRPPLIRSTADAGGPFPLALAIALLLLPILTPVPAPAQPPTALPQLSAAAVIERDVDGVPHVNAANEHDLFFLQGWIHAQDRLFQMDLSRRQPSGTLAEVVGPPALASDVQLRTLGLRRAAERTLPVLSRRSKEALQAYADGVNAWVAAHPLPPEYGALELASFEPWTPVDSVVIAKLIAFGLSFDLDIGLTQTLIAYQTAGAQAGFDGEALFFEDLFRSAPFDPATTLLDAGVEPPILVPKAPVPPDNPPPVGAPGELPATAELPEDLSPWATIPGGLANALETRPLSLSDLARRASDRLHPATLEMAADYLDSVREIPLLRSAVSPRERIQGSNEWAVAGTRTENLRPLLANDPHLALDTPATFYQIHLRSPAARLDVVGSGFPGVPFVILGQNQRIAWGATTNPMDVTDTFQEQLVIDPDLGLPVATVHGDQVEPVDVIPQTFRFNQIGDAVPDNLATAPGGTAVGGVFIPPVVITVPRRNDGPLVDFDPEAGVGLSVQYTGFGPTREIEAFRVWNRARNLGDFLEGLQLFDFGSQNFVYADVFGFIGYFTSGEMPLREDLQAGTVIGLPPFFIRDGSGGNEWLAVQNPQPEQSLPYEILPFDEMPQLVNPPAGYFVNANNDPAGTTLDNNPLNQLRPGGEGIYYLSPGYAGGFRAGTITRRLREKLREGRVDADDMAEIQADVSLLDASAFLPYLFRAFDRAFRPGSDPQLQELADLPRTVDAIGRLAAWDHTTPTGIAEGFDATDVDGTRGQPSPEEVENSVAATIYSVWRGQLIRRTVDAALEPLGLPTPGSRESMAAVRNLLDRFPEHQGFGASGLDFFPVDGVANRQDARDLTLLAALLDALDLLAGEAFEPAFGGSADPDDYRWGKLHRIVFDHPLGPPFSVPPAFGGFPPPLPGLDGIPTDGGFGVVDASSHSARADSADDFMFGSGPVRRYVGHPTGPGTFFDARTILPGGMSGVPGSPFQLNLLPRWLTNDTYPVRQSFDDYQPAVVERFRFVPQP